MTDKQTMEILGLCQDKEKGYAEKQALITKSLGCGEKEARDLILACDLFDKVRNRRYGHTDFWDTFDAIKKHILSEIEVAVRENGGEVNFEGRSFGINANRDGDIVNIFLEGIFLNENDRLEMSARYVDGWEDEVVDDIEVSDILIEELGEILTVMHNCGLLR